MSDREKSLITGMLYNPGADGLPEDRHHARNLCRKISNCDDSKERNAFVQQLFAKSDDSTTLNGNFMRDYGYNIEVGKSCYMMVRS